MSLLFNVLSELIITFLPMSKRLLISWLQSPSAVILGPPQNKVCHCPHCCPIYLPWSDGTRCHDLSVIMITKCGSILLNQKVTIKIWLFNSIFEPKFCFSFGLVLKVFHFLLWSAEELGAGEGESVWLLKVSEFRSMWYYLWWYIFKGQSDKVCKVDCEFINEFSPEHISGFFSSWEVP